MTYIAYKTNVEEMEELGQISMALTDSQSTFIDGTTNDNAQKLFYKNGTLSFGAGVGQSLRKQSEIISGLESKIDAEMIEKTIFPELIESHYEFIDLDDLMKLDEKEIIHLVRTDPEIRKKLQNGSAKTYIIVNSDDVHEGFKLDLSGSFYPPNTIEIEKFNRPSVTKEESGYDGSGLQTLRQQSDVMKNLDKSDFVEFELDPKFKVLSPMYELLSSATTASKSQDVNDKFQIGIMNGDQVSLLYHPDVSFESSNQNLEYINNVLNTNIGLDCEVDFIRARLLVDRISDEFFSKYREIGKTHLALDKKLRDNRSNRLEVDAGTVSEINEDYISLRESFDKYLIHFINGDLYKIIKGSTKNGKEIKALQEKYPSE